MKYDTSRVDPAQFLQRTKCNFAAVTFHVTRHVLPYIVYTCANACSNPNGVLLGTQCDKSFVTENRVG